MKSLALANELKEKLLHLPPDAWGPAISQFMKQQRPLKWSGDTKMLRDPTSYGYQMHTDHMDAPVEFANKHVRITIEEIM